MKDIEQHSLTEGAQEAFLTEPVNQYVSLLRKTEQLEREVTSQFRELLRDYQMEIVHQARQAPLIDRGTQQGTVETLRPEVEKYTGTWDVTLPDGGQETRELTLDEELNEIAGKATYKGRTKLVDKMPDNSFLIVILDIRESGIAAGGLVRLIDKATGTDQTLELHDGSKLRYTSSVEGRTSRSGPKVTPPDILNIMTREYTLLRDGKLRPVIGPTSEIPSA